MVSKRTIRARAAHVRDLLTGSPAVTHALDLQRRENGLLAQVRDLLAPGARPHCIQASATEGTLKVTVDSSAWATRLRYAAPDLAQGLAAAGITAVKIRTRPAEQKASRQTTQRVTRLAPAVVDHLITAADHMADAGIAEIFRRLAARHRGPRVDPLTDPPRGGEPFN